MTAYYSKEKAKFGGVTGTIIPYMITITDNVNRDFLPAGFLKCDGSILKASVYPALANTIGIGSNCRFAKNRDDIAADEIQLPDLGSKYIRVSTSSGQYLNTTLEQDPQISKVGTEVEVISLVGDSTTISYAGFFEVLGQNGLKFIGNPVFETESGFTLSDALNEENFQSHGHYADVGVFTYLGKWSDNVFVEGYARGGNEAQTEGSNNLVQVISPDQASTTTTHNHRINLPGSTELKANNTLSYSFSNVNGSLQYPADGLTSEVTLTTSNVKKLDDIISPYILVEYIIKI
jgi:hypothetical protein